MPKNNFYSKVYGIVGIIFFMFPFFVHAADFPHYAVQAILGRDGTLGVEEHFTYDFGPLGNHGVLREIPLFTGGRTPTPITFHMISVGDKEGAPYKHDATSGGNVAFIRIGDKDALLTGAHYYDLRYTLTGTATDHNLRWQITTPVKEIVKKFQADIYFTIPVPPITATGTCAFVPDRGTHQCLLKPLIKEDKLYGFRVSAENVVKEGVVVELVYPKGLIEPPLVTTRDTPREFPKYLLYVLAAVIFFSLLGVVLWHFRQHIVRWRVERKKPVLLPDAFSYLARAMADRGSISQRDIIATIADLAARGYIALNPIPHAVGEFEFIDYALEVSTTDFPGGSEGVLLSIIAASDITSLNSWLHGTYKEHLSEIEDAARSEVEGIVLLRSDESLPDLPVFKSERFLSQ